MILAGFLYVVLNTRSSGTTGNFCGALLAYFGASVIKASCLSSLLLLSMSQCCPQQGASYLNIHWLDSG